MDPKLFVGGLPFTYSNIELAALFAPVGQVVSAKMVLDPPNGRTRGFGFVQMSTMEEAQAAIAQLNGTKVGEKSIFVTQARERAPRRDSPSSKPFTRKDSRDFRSPRPNALPASFDDARRSTGQGPRSYKGKRPFDRSSQPGGFRPERSPFGKGPSRPYQGKRPYDPSKARPSSYGGSAFPSARPFPARGRQGPGSAPPAPGGFNKGPRPYQGKRPYDPSKARPSFGGGLPAGQAGAAPRGEGRRSFSAPRQPQGDFGPSRRGPKGPGKPKPASRSAPKPFWNKFDKKKPRQE